MSAAAVAKQPEVPELLRLRAENAALRDQLRFVTEERDELAALNYEHLAEQQWLEYDPEEIGTWIHTHRAHGAKAGWARTALTRMRQGEPIKGGRARVEKVAREFGIDPTDVPEPIKLVDEEP